MAMSGRAAAAPVPLRASRAVGVSASLEGMSRLALAAPVVVGWKRSVAVQLAPGASCWFEQPSACRSKGGQQLAGRAELAEEQIGGAVVGHGHRLLRQAADGHGPEGQLAIARRGH